MILDSDDMKILIACFAETTPAIGIVKIELYASHELYIAPEMGSEKIAWHVEFMPCHPGKRIIILSPKVKSMLTVVVSIRAVTAPAAGDTKLITGVILKAPTAENDRITIESMIP